MLVLSPIELPNDEHVKHREPNTLAYLRNTSLGTGTLFISTDRFTWRTDNGQGFTLEYPQISLHGISRDLSNFHSECLYLMFENDDEDCEQDNDSNLDSEAIDQPNELRFVPQDLSKIEEMYRALSSCQLLHPDPQDSVSENGDYPDSEDHEDEIEDMDVVDGQFDDAN